MRLYLVQHGRACSEAEDKSKPLSDVGRRDMARMAEFVKGLDLSVDYLWHSGKVRAAQTAELLAEEIVVRRGKAARDGLGPLDDVGGLRDELLGVAEDVMIVGHLPFLSRLASVLLGGCESSDTVAFQNGGIVCLCRGEQDRWQIEWLVTPQLIA